MYVTLPEGATEAQAREQYQAMYAGEGFIHLLKPGQVAILSHSVNSNYCTIGLTPVPGTQTLIVTCTIDNLIKGASGQAIQNMNLMFDLPESTGLL